MHLCVVTHLYYILASSEFPLLFHILQVKKNAKVISTTEKHCSVTTLPTRPSVLFLPLWAVASDLKSFLITVEGTIQKLGHIFFLYRDRAMKRIYTSGFQAGAEAAAQGSTAYTDLALLILSWRHLNNFPLLSDMLHKKLAINKHFVLIIQQAQKIK